MKDAIDMLKHFEGLRLEAYKCPSGKWTIGYGHTVGVTPGQTIGATDAEELLRKDVAYYASVIDKHVTVPLSANQRAALISFAFNVGANHFRQSTLLSKLNDGDYNSAAHELERWVNVAGEVSRGLVRRREAELRLFLTPVPADS